MFRLDLRQGCVVRIEEDLTRAQEIQGSQWVQHSETSIDTDLLT